MKRINYFWPAQLVKITGIIFASQLIIELSGVAIRKQGFEWVIYACAVAFIFSLIYALIAIFINVWNSKRDNSTSRRV